MKYFEVTFQIESDFEFINDVLSRKLGEIGFESFLEQGDALLAYIPKDNYDSKLIDEIILNFPIEGCFNYSVKEMEDKDWYEEWEKNFFQPIIIDDKCVIRSSFHQGTPKLEYEIIINPQMAFGTGHHETTSSVIRHLLEIDLKGKTVLDMGCGTSILAILASMRGAKDLLAIDIDDWCIRNSEENLLLNNIQNVTVELGDAQTIGDRHFDFIIANINRNILLRDMPYYVKSLNKKGSLLMSGFYSEDIPMIEAEANRLGLKKISVKEKNNWVAVLFKDEK